MRKKIKKTKSIFCRLNTKLDISLLENIITLYKQVTIDLQYKSFIKRI